MASSPLGAARLRRRLTIEEAAARAEMDIDAVRSLEENRVYRFGSNADALAAALVYAAALGVSEREARDIAGLPVRPRLIAPWWRRRWLAVGSATVAVGVALALFLQPNLAAENSPAATSAPPRTAAKPALPERWEIEVDVYNGTRIGNAAASVANQIAGLAYRMGDVKNANRRDYRQTRVYYPPGAEDIARRLAAELGIGMTALPGGDNPRRLVVIIGSAS
jgi:LytR cell envelope-related transcriptional attenuator